jgi:hypothetical protein
MQAGKTRTKVIAHNAIGVVVNTLVLPKRALSSGDTHESGSAIHQAPRWPRIRRQSEDSASGMIRRIYARARHAADVGFTSTSWSSLNLRPAADDDLGQLMSGSGTG